MPLQNKGLPKPAIFLDRDGVLNKSFVVNGKPYAPKRFEDFEIFPYAKEATEKLKNMGYLLVVVTNQPDVGNGMTDIEVVEKMHAHLKQTLPIDMIKVCYHAQQEGCECRKPKPGMLYEAAQELNIDLKSSIMIGDRASDISAGKAAGCRTFFIDYGYSEETSICADFIVNSLEDVLEKMLIQCRPSSLNKYDN